MIDKNPSDRNRFITGILIVASIVLLAASIYSVYAAWRTGLAQSRAETASRLMAIRTSPRSTETPGINAWVSWSLLNSNLDGTPEQNARLRQLVTPRSNNQIPQEFRPLVDVLRNHTVQDERETIEFKTDSDLGGQTSESKLQFRKVSYVQLNDDILVITNRESDKIQTGLRPYAERASQHLTAVRDSWRSKPQLNSFDQFPRLRSARVARFYVLNEEESIISLPLGDNNVTGSPNNLYLSEGKEFRKNPLSPTFVSNSFFFNFQFDKPLQEQAIFSGLYLDLGGLGLVASVTTPVIYEGKRCVLGADIAFDMDWEDFARNLSPNLLSHVVRVSNPNSSNWNPWNEFYNNIPDTKPELQRTVQILSDRESLSSTPTFRKSVYLANSGGSDIMAIQVNRSTWLLLQVAANEIKLPWATMLLTATVFLSLVFRIELSRRQAVAAQRAARNEMQEKQNLLDTMQVPLMVVDPNTDQLVYCNRAAQTIGMHQGCYFGRDIVSQDRAAQEQYHRTQVLGGEHRRAYGIPIRVSENDHENQSARAKHAIVRSVAVTAPIESLHADERHRLGILFLIDEHLDLALLLNDRIQETARDEKRRLSGLLNHGVDSLARVLRNQLRDIKKNTPVSDDKRLFATWLSHYLSERIQLLAWTLENWGTTPSMTERHMIERQTVLKTIDQHNQIFAIAASDRLLREQLHWNNGAITGTSKNDGEHPLIQTNFDWDDDSCFAVPRDGVFGFLLGESLVNAIRHGKPGSKIQLTVQQNRQRNEFDFIVSNEINTNAVGSPAGSKPFGGTTIMTELARLSGWTEPTCECINEQFRLCWTIPAIRRKTDGKGD